MKFNYKLSKLDNGIRVISVPLGSTAAVTSLVLVGTGSHYEKKELAGISHYLEHLFFKGSKKYPSAHKISTILDTIGASYNAFTAEEMTGFYVKTVKDKAELALDVMSDYLKNPLFKDEEIERERGVIIEELRMYYDMPQRHVHDVFREALYGEQPAGRSIGGYEDTVAKIKPSDIREYFKKQYRGDNIVAVFAGNITHGHARELAEKHLGELPEGNSFEKEPIKAPEAIGPSVAIEQKESDQTHIVLGFNGIDINDDRKYALEVLAVVLGGGMSSRLFTEIRERRGLAYYVRAGADAGTDFGDFEASAGIANPKLEEAVEVLVNEFKKIRDNNIEKEEIDKAKSHIEGSTMLGLETSNSVAFYTGNYQLLMKKIITPEEYLQNIKKVTAKDVKEIAGDIFKKETCRLALVGPYKNEKKLEEILNKL
ncbi:MAG: pitrilysin family protein [Candidatus Spechtbacterales bacterium]|nr:pitrilysin family protein [Candidatus Spechtbacterales bacterium]